VKKGGKPNGTKLSLLKVVFVSVSYFFHFMSWYR